MKANLIQRVALGVGAVISLAGISGCTEEEARIGSFLGTVGIMNPNSTPKEAALWGGVRQASQDSLNSYNAEKSRTEVNVNVGESSQRSPVYTSYIWDLNSNTILNEKPMSSSQVDEFVSGKFIPGKGYEILIYKDGVYDSSYNIRSP